MSTETPRGFERRRFLQVGAAGIAGVALGSAGGLSPADAATPLRESWPGGQLSLGDRKFLEHGLQHMAWISSPGSPEPYPSASEYLGSGFTGPCYYHGSPDGMYNTPLQSRLGDSLWGTARFPNANNGGSIGGADGRITGPPQPGQKLLSPVQRANLDRMFSACFGDEEPYSPDELVWRAQYYDLMRDQAPEVLVYGNQGSRFTDEQMRKMIRTTRPDLISWDDYLFSNGSPWRIGSVTTLYDNLFRYRRLALEGLDGTGEQPINFGQYTLGFRTGAGQWDSGDYVASDSQLGVVPYVTWAMGGKLLNLFRYTTRAFDGSTDFLLNKPDGSISPQYHLYAGLNAEMRALSPYLCRLRTHSVSIRRGLCHPEAPTTTPRSTVPDWDAGIDRDSQISALSATNLGGANGGLPGDILVGTFRTLPGLTARDARGLVGPDTHAFMLVNALAVPNAVWSDWNGTGGTGEETRQRVHVSLRLAPAQRPDGARLFRIDRATGRELPVRLTKTGPDTASFDHDIDGGRGDLFIWK